MLLVRAETRRRFRGFTLVELMVAAALAVTIMWILAESFKMSIDFVRTARSTGDMLTQLNNAGQIMMRDLGQEGTYSANGRPQHFLPPAPPYPQINGAMRNIAQMPMPDNLNTTTNIAAATGYSPPSGYFHLYSPPPNVSWASFQSPATQFFIDTINPQTVPANGSTTGHQLKFTAFLPQGLPQNQFVAVSPPGSSNIYSSRAAEIAYFLGPPTGATQAQIVTSTMSEPPANGGAALPLFNLYRRQRLVAVTTDFAMSGPATAPPNLNAPFTTNTQYSDPNATDVISATQMPNGQYVVNTLASFSAPYNNNTSAPIRATRVPATPLATLGRIGDDIVLSNVVSFEVLAAWDWSPTIALPAATSQFPRHFLNANGTTILNSNAPFDFLPPTNFNSTHPSTFDTGTAYMLPPVPTNNGPVPNPANWNNFSTAGTNPNLLPMPARVNAIQITIRVYDPKTHQTRQNTWRVSL